LAKYCSYNLRGNLNFLLWILHRYQDFPLNFKGDYRQYFTQRGFYAKTCLLLFIAKYRKIFAKIFYYGYIFIYFAYSDEKMLLYNENKVAKAYFGKYCNKFCDNFLRCFPNLIFLSCTIVLFSIITSEINKNKFTREVMKILPPNSRGDTFYISMGDTFDILPINSVY